VHYPINMILFKTQILFMNSLLTIKYFNFFGGWDGKIFPWSRLKLRFWDVLGCLQCLLERLAITKYETNGALVEVTIEVVVPSDLSCKIYILCNVLRQDWIWVKWPSNSRLKSISIPTDFSVQWPLISLTRSYESKAVFAVNHNASLFSLSEGEAHSQKIKTVEDEQPQRSYSSWFCKVLAKTNFVSPICHCIKLDCEQKMFQSDKKHARHITKYHDHT
jgi:hypothetical protein